MAGLLEQTFEAFFFGRVQRGAFFELRRNGRLRTPHCLAYEAKLPFELSARPAYKLMHGQRHSFMRFQFPIARLRRKQGSLLTPNGENQFDLAKELGQRISLDSMNSLEQITAKTRPKNRMIGRSLSGDRFQPKTNCDQGSPAGAHAPETVEPPGFLQ